MPIKSSQTLISEALKEIKTISPVEALKLSNENIKKKNTKSVLLFIFSNIDQYY